MQVLSRITQALLFPFEFLGSLIAFSWNFFWQLTGKFLLSPWGLIVPITFLATLFLILQIDRNPLDLVEQYTAELEQCEDDQVLQPVRALLHLGEVGIPGLVRGLQSEREAVFLACQDALEYELKRWEVLEDTVERNRCYRILSTALAEQVPNFRPTAQLAAYRLVRQMLHRLSELKANSSNSVPESTQSAEGATKKSHAPIKPTKESLAASAEAQQALQQCERVLAVVERVRQQSTLPDAPGNAPLAQTLAQSGKEIFRSVLMASNGQPFQASADMGNFAQTAEYAWNDSSSEDSTIQVDPFSAPRAERLLAYHSSPNYLAETEMSIRRQGASPTARTPSNGSEEARDAMASMLPNTVAAPPWAEAGNKIARQYESSKAEDESRESRPSEKGIADHYQNRSNRDKSVTDRSRGVTNRNANEFLTSELLDISMSSVPLLPSSRLMRLLQHPDERIVVEARKTLVARDGFRDIHLDLAFRLYHPNPSVREGIFPLLSTTRDIQPNVWLSELLGDPYAEIRYRAASTLATSSDPAMQRLVIERGKRDPDGRLVQLADILLERQGKRTGR